MAEFNIDSDSFHSALEILFEQALEQGLFQSGVTSAEYIIGGPRGAKMTVKVKGPKSSRALDTSSEEQGR